jgi:hypothetical protein
MGQKGQLFPKGKVCVVNGKWERGWFYSIYVTLKFKLTLSKSHDFKFKPQIR